MAKHNQHRDKHIVDEFKVLLMINKRGFRHSEMERNFVASQVNWVYGDNFRHVAGFARRMMALVNDSVFAMSRETRGKFKTDTEIMLTREGVGSNRVTERFKAGDNFFIEVIEISDNEKQELKDIISGKVESSNTNDLAGYFDHMADDTAQEFKLPIGMTGSAFLRAMAKELRREEKSIVPISMVHEHLVDRNALTLILSAKDEDQTHVVRIQYTAE